MMRAVGFSVVGAMLCAASMAQGFVENRGQWAEDFWYRASIPSGVVFLERNSITFHLVDRSDLYGAHWQRDRTKATNIEHHHAFRLRFLGSNANPAHSTAHPYPFYLNYFLGADSRRWQAGIVPAHTVVYENLYEGITMRVMEHESQLKYEFIVQAGADPRRIRIKAEGLDSLRTDRHGNLIMQTSLAHLMERKPVAYQERGNRKWEVDAAFVIAGNVVSYALGDYDPTLPLVIDPELVFSTFSGSTADNWGFTATPDVNGFAFTGSATAADGYPTTTGAYDLSYNGPVGQLPGDVCITKYDTSGTSLVYSTYLGGESSEIPHSMIVDESGNLFVFGTTSSDDFPTTSGAYDRSHNGGGAITNLTFSIPFPNGADIFVVKFNTNGSALLGATFVGGSGTDGLNTGALAYNYADEARGEINLDHDGNVVVTSGTSSTNFPGTSGNARPTHAGALDAVVFKMTSDLKTLTWATYLGGSQNDAGYGVDVASDNSLYVCGGTRSGNFPTTTGAFDQSYNQNTDGFIAHLSANGKTLLHSTYFGTGAYDQMYLMQLNKADEPHVFGQTEHTGANFIFNAAYNNVGGGQVVARFRPDLGSLAWSTQWGSSSGHPNISPTAMLVDVCNSVYLAGWGGPLNQEFGNGNPATVNGLPTTSSALKSASQVDEARGEFYLCVLEGDGNALTYATLFGGDQSAFQNTTHEHVDGGTSRFDRAGKVYQAVCAGCGGSNEFPIFPEDAWSETNNSSNCNSAIFKIDFLLPLVIADFNMPSFVCAPVTVQLNNTSVTQNTTTFVWTVNNLPYSQQASPNITFTQSGEYTVRLVVNDPNSCNLSDTISRTIIVKVDTAYTLPAIDTCIGSPIAIGPDPANYDNIGNAQLSWSPAGPLNNPTALNPTATVFANTTFLLTINYGGCSELITQTVMIDTVPLHMPDDTIVCSNFSPFTVVGSAFGQAESFQWSNKADFSTVLSTDSTLEITALPLPVNRFYFRAVKPNGCPTIDTLLVTVADYDFQLTSDTFVCKNDDARIEVRHEDPNNTFFYFWTRKPYSDDPDQELLTDSTSRFLDISESESTVIYVYGKSLKVDGCNASDSVRVEVSRLDREMVKATADRDTFYLGQTVQLHGEPSTGYDHHWHPATYLNDSTLADPVAKPKETMEYVYTVSDKDVPQCSFSDTVTIRPYEIICGEPEVFLPTAFTPNADGLNDALFLRGRNVKTVDLAIYDRWGRLVFESHDQQYGWDGTLNGKPVENAVYVFYFEVTCIDNQRLYREGNITVYGQ